MLRPCALGMQDFPRKGGDLGGPRCLSGAGKSNSQAHTFQFGISQYMYEH